MKVWIWRDKRGPVCVGPGEPDFADSIDSDPVWTGPHVVLCIEEANRILDALGITLEPGEAHALELTPLNYGWVMEEVGDE